MHVPLHIINNQQYKWRTVFVNDREHITLDDVTQRNLFWLEIWAYALTQKHNTTPLMNEIDEHSPVYIDSSNSEIMDDGLSAFTTIYAVPPTIIKVNNVMVVIVYLIILALLLLFYYFEPSLDVSW